MCELLKCKGFKIFKQKKNECRNVGVLSMSHSFLVGPALSSAQKKFFSFIPVKNYDTMGDASNF